MEIPVPTVKKDYVLIKVEAVSINPLDWKIQDGYVKHILPPRFPHIPGTLLSHTMWKSKTLVVNSNKMYWLFWFVLWSIWDFRSVVFGPLARIRKERVTKFETNCVCLGDFRMSNSDWTGKTCSWGQALMFQARLWVLVMELQLLHRVTRLWVALARYVRVSLFTDSPSKQNETF